MSLIFLLPGEMRKCFFCDRGTWGWRALFYGTSKFITTFTRAYHWILS